MLGKTFKGMTDEMLAWQTERFTELSTDDDGWVVTVRPEQVVEIAFDGLQRSTRYPGGVALRFARVLRYRDDKTAAEADTIDDRPGAGGSAVSLFRRRVGWVLADAVEKHAAAPDTFRIPSDDAVAAVQVGDRVKLIVEPSHRARRAHVGHRDDGGRRELEGTLASDPAELRGLHAGDAVQFERRHVVAISRRPRSDGPSDGARTAGVRSWQRSAPRLTGRTVVAQRRYVRPSSELGR